MIYQFREWSRPQDPKCTIINIVLIVQVCIFLEIPPKLTFFEPSQETSFHVSLLEERLRAIN